MSHRITFVITQRNLANAISSTKSGTIKRPGTHAGPYKVFVPVEIIFDNLGIEELDELLSRPAKLTLTGDLADKIGEPLRIFKPSQKGIEITALRKAKRQAGTPFVKIFCCADLWNIRNKCRRFSIYHTQCYS